MGNRNNKNNNSNWQEKKAPVGIAYGDKVGDDLRVILDEVVKDYIKIQDDIGESTSKAGKLDYTLQLILKSYLDLLLKRHAKLKDKSFKTTRRLYDKYFELVNFCQDIHKALKAAHAFIENLTVDELKDKGDKATVAEHLKSHRQNFGKDHIAECKLKNWIPKVSTYLDEFYYVVNMRIEPYIIDHTELNNKLAELAKLMPKLIASEISLTVQLIFTIIPEQTVITVQSVIESTKEEQGKILDLPLKYPIKDILEKSFGKLVAFADLTEDNQEESLRQYANHQNLIIRCKNLHDALNSTREISLFTEEYDEKVLKKTEEHYKDQVAKDIDVSIEDLEMLYAEAAFAL